MLFLSFNTIIMNGESCKGFGIGAAAYFIAVADFPPEDSNHIPSEYMCTYYLYFTNMHRKIA
jgi:hypothetical protein